MAYQGKVQNFLALAKAKCKIWGHLTGKWVCDEGLDAAHPIPCLLTQVAPPGHTYAPLMKFEVLLGKTMPAKAV